MAELTLCMIVRDEEALLAQCLESAKPAVDRMVIVDTGSQDATRDIIRDFGAELVEHEWNDDFAAARNAGLERIAGGYVLVLDADECLTRSAARTLRAAVRKGRVDLGLLPLHNATSLDASVEDVIGGRARRGDPQLLPRLLRRTPDLRYDGVVHESVAAWARAGRKVETIDAAIVHYGAAPELRAERGKDERNLRLLERRCELEPENPTAWAYLAAERERSEMDAAALEAARRAWGCWQEAKSRAEDHDAVLPATLLAQLALRAGHASEAHTAASVALEEIEHPNLHLLAGVALEADDAGEAATLAKASGHYERCLALAQTHYTSEVMPGATSWQAATRLATVRLQQGEPATALELFEKAAGQRPELLEARLGVAEATLSKGSAEAALAGLEALMAAAPGPDAWLLAARCALALGALDDAQLLFGRACEISRSHAFVAPHRRRALAELAVQLEAFRGGEAARASGAAAPNAEELSREASPNICVFAWPRYDDAKDLDALLGDFGHALCDRSDLVLCLRHDPQVDSEIAEAEERLQRAFADHLGEERSLQIVLIDGAHQPEELAASGDVAIELPGTTGTRRRFLSSLGVHRVNDPGALRQALGRTH